jgi:Na+/glutamate symporter
VSHIAGGIGGAVAWVGLGRDLAPDGGLLAAALIAFAGAATLGSVASGLMGGRMPNAPTKSG